MVGKPQGSLLPKKWQNSMPQASAPEKNEAAASARPASLKSGKPARLVSLDAYRGFIMTMLAANGFGILAFSRIEPDSPVWQVHDYAWWQNLAIQFEHPPWVSVFGLAGVAFWDLIQPAFMFMVGVSMPFSYGRRAMMGQKDSARMLHALLRSVVLVLMGVFLNSMGDQRTDWAFPNVLCQIGLGYFFAWLLLNRSLPVQVTSLVLLLLANWLMFFVNTPPADYDYEAVNASAENGEIFEGRFAPWSKNANTAYLFDEWLLPRLRTPLPEVSPETAMVQDSAMAAQSAMVADSAMAADSAMVSDPTSQPMSDSVQAEPNTVADASATDETAEETVDNVTAAAPPEPGLLRTWFFSNREPYQPNRGGYTTLNFVPSIGTILLGMICGQLLLASAVSPWKKLVLLIGGAVLCLAIGVGLHQFAVPIVKRIWTPSWVFFSGGFVIGMLALFYLLFDLLPLKLLAFPLVVVGMNSILIYMMGQTIRGWTSRSVLKTHFSGFIETVLGPKALDPLWYAPVTEATGVFLLFWLFLFWLYRQKIFLRI